MIERTLLEVKFALRRPLLDLTRRHRGRAILVQQTEARLEVLSLAIGDEPARDFRQRQNERDDRGCQVSRLD